LNSSPQKIYEKQFKELIKKKTELKKEYEANLTFLPAKQQSQDFVKKQGKKET